MVKQAHVRTRTLLTVRGQKGESWWSSRRCGFQLGYVHLPTREGECLRIARIYQCRLRTQIAVASFSR